MLRQYEGPEVRIDPVELGPGRVVKVDDDRSVFLPAAISAYIDGEAFDVEFVVLNVTDHPDPVIAEIKISMKHEAGAPPVSPDMVRGIPMGKARKRAVELASVPVKQDGDVLHILPEVGDAESTRAAFRRDRRSTVTKDLLEQAVTIYERIGDEPGDTLVGVAAALNVSRATAGRYIARARKLGLLEEEQ